MVLKPLIFVSLEALPLPGAANKSNCPAALAFAAYGRMKGLFENIHELKGKIEEKHHIKNAYVTSLVKNNGKSKSKKVALTKGEYVYFCPLNPTPQYTLRVQ